MASVSDKIIQLPGYRIVDSHFRIGSKIHVSDFYYAKRFFQNSFFSSRLAYLIVQEILTGHAERIDDFKSGGLTLIGYGLFSELLLSLVEKFLRMCLGVDNVNHDLINDIEEPILIKRYEPVYKNVLIIVPIASTFLTGIKIEDFLRKECLGSDILRPVLNVIHVADRHAGEECTALEVKFGWRRKSTSNHSVDVRTYFSDEVRLGTADPVSAQKYIFELPSDWHEIESCELCFPLEPTEEKPLFYTEPTALNPALIYATPQGRHIYERATADKDQRNDFDIRPESLVYGHYIRDDNHFRYYIKVEEFFNHNKAQVTGWLKNEVRNSVRFRELHSFTNRTVIIAPGHFSNAGFVNLVNETLFSNSANIIHYDPRNDDIQNFKLFYGNEFQDPDAKVFFVDDTITSGETFIKTNYFLKHTRISNLQIDACIFLMDRSSHYTHENVLRKMESGKDSYFVFANLNLPSLRGLDGKCPLCLERDRYKELVDNTFLDRLKLHFLKQQMKLRERRIRESSHDATGGYSGHDDKYRYIRRMEAFDRIYRWFSNPDPGFSEMTFDQWKADVLRTPEASGASGRRLVGRLPIGTADGECISDETAAILKVLTKPPFSNYQPLRRKTFEWVITLLDNQRKKVISEIRGDKFQYNTFRDFKFLVRRAGQLNSNYLISQVFFDVLALLYTDQGLAQLLQSIETQASAVSMEPRPASFADRQRQLAFDEGEQRRTDNTKRAQSASLTSFRNYYAAQVKELLFLNEARSIRLEETVRGYETRYTVARQFRQLLRVLREENGIVIHKFWEFVENNKDLLDVDINQWGVEGKIREILLLEPIRHHYRFQTLQAYFTADGQSAPEDNRWFIAFLWLMLFFKLERSKRNRAELSLNQKTELLIDRMKNIVSSDSVNSGAFFVVSYGLGLGKDPNSIRTFFAHNAGIGNGVDKSLWNSNDSNFLESLFRGVIKGGANNKSIIELQRETNGRWVNMYSGEDNDDIPDLHSNFVPAGCNRLLLMRINKKRLEVLVDGSEEIIDIPQAIIGFYFSDGSRDVTSVSRTRYLLLLRSTISEFIENHHENDEFRDWIEAENKRRTALLTGHGREMLIDVAKRYPEYRDIISTILLAQRFVLDLEEELEFDLKRELTPTRSISRVFREIFQPKDGLFVHSQFDKLMEMGADIYRFEEIENTEACKTTFVQSGDVPADFLFPLDILQMICFELFVNAKKNRWIFLDGGSIEAGGQCYDQNELGLVIQSSGSQLQLTISNTGPRVLEDVISDLNNQKNPKTYGSVAGVELITKMLIEFDLGSIHFTQETIKADFCRFNAVLTLNPWLGKLQ